MNIRTVLVAILMALCVSQAYSDGIIIIDPPPMPMPIPITRPRRHTYVPLAVKYHRVTTDRALAHVFVKDTL